MHMTPYRIFFSYEDAHCNTYRTSVAVSSLSDVKALETRLSETHLNYERDKIVKIVELTPDELAVVMDVSLSDERN